MQQKDYPQVLSKERTFHCLIPVLGLLCVSVCQGAYAENFTDAVKCPWGLGTKPYYSITQVPWPLSQYKRPLELDTQARGRLLGQKVYRSTPARTGLRNPYPDWHKISETVTLTGTRFGPYH